MINVKAEDKAFFFSPNQKVLIFFLFLHENIFYEALLMSTHNICFCGVKIAVFT